MNHTTEAERLFLEGYNCAQAVFAAFRDMTGMELDAALRLASPFGGGMGKLRQTCGAVTGAFMVIGVLWGYDTTGIPEKTALYTRVQQIAQQFEEQYRTINCTELLKGLKIDTLPVPEARTPEYYAKRPCLRFVHTAAALLDQMIAEDL